MWLRLTMVRDVDCAPGILIMIMIISGKIEHKRALHRAPLAVNSLMIFVTKSSGGPKRGRY